MATVYVVTEVSGEYDPVTFRTEKRAQYWIDQQMAEDDDLEFEITESTVDEMLDADECELADNQEESAEEEEELEEA